METPKFLVASKAIYRSAAPRTRRDASPINIRDILVVIPYTNAGLHCTCLSFLHVESFVCDPDRALC